MEEARTVRMTKMTWETPQSTRTSIVAGTSRRENVKRAGGACGPTGEPDEEAITRLRWLEWESERPVVAVKLGNAGGAKGLYRKHVSNEERIAN